MKEKGKSNKSRKRIITILLIAIIAVVAVVIGIVIYSKIKTEESKIQNRKDYEETLSVVKDEFFEEGKIVPDNYNFYTRLYDGTVKDEIVYERIYYLVKVAIPNINKTLGNMSEGDLRSYYKKNKERIEAGLGSENENEFVKIVKTIKEKNLNNYKDASFDVANYEDGDPFVKLPLKLTFDNGELNVNIYVAKRNGTGTLVMIKTE